MTKQLQSEIASAPTTSFAARYNRIDKFTEEFAETLVKLSGISHSTLEPLVVFDNACGTGAVSKVLAQTLGRGTDKTWRLTCGDTAETMLAYTKQRIDEEGWSFAEAMIIDAQDTGLPSGRYTHIFTAFAFSLFPDPRAALRECFRSLQTKGTLAISLWKKCNWFEIVKDALSFLPGNLPLPAQQDEITSLHKKGWDSESCIRGFLEEVGFKDVDVSTTEKKTVLPLDEVADACQMIAPFVVSQFWTEEQRNRYAGMVPEAIKKHLAEKFGEGKPGFLEARVIIAVARKG